MRLALTSLLLLSPVANAMAQTSLAQRATGYVPRLSITDSGIGGKDRNIRHEIVVLRDVDPSSDDKVILVKTVVDQTPAIPALSWKGQFTDGPYGTAVLMADAYLVDTHLVFPGGEVPTAVLEAQQPQSDGAVDRTITETVRTSVTAGVSAAPESLGALAMGKVPLSVSGGIERSEERSVSMTLKDYFVASANGPDDKGNPGATWRFNLARDIANDMWYAYSHYNVLHGYLYSTSRLTPMMRKATLETAAVWRIPGDFEGVVDVVTSSTVNGRLHDSFARWNKVLETPAANISLTTRVDLGSPHLARQPVVRLQSLSGQGDCLAQPSAVAAAVVMQRCAPREENAGQQWYLDTDLTYRNVGSGQCLTADPLTGGVHAAACAGAVLTQRWEWRADRLHAMYMDGGNWRLHVKQGVPMAIFDPARHQDIVTNVYHPLLRPWSSYPQAPTMGDVIPSLTTSSPAVPASFLSFRGVGAEERWQPVPIDAAR